MRMQFPMTADGRARYVAGSDATTVSRVNTIIDRMVKASGHMRLPIDSNGCAEVEVESLVADLPEGVSLAYQRSLWHKDQFAVFEHGRRVEVVYRHSGNGTVTYMSWR